MRQYDDPVEVRRGMVAGTEGPEQFLWRGRLWKVCAVVSHWVETGPWWETAGVRAVLGADDPVGPGSAAGSAEGAPVDLGAERECWRVEAARGLAAAGSAGAGGGAGVFDLVFDWAVGSWRLARCVD